LFQLKIIKFVPENSPFDQNFSLETIKLLEQNKDFFPYINNLVLPNFSVDTHGQARGYLHKRS